MAICSRKAQGATEYLVIFGVVLVLSVVSVSLLGSTFDTTSENQETASKIYWQSGVSPIRVPEAVRTDDSKFAFAMENSVGDPVTPTGVNVDGADVAFGEGSNSSYLNQSVYLAPGEKKLVRIDLG